MVTRGQRAGKGNTRGTKTRGVVHRAPSVGDVSVNRAGTGCRRRGVPANARTGVDGEQRFSGVGAEL